MNLSPSKIELSMHKARILLNPINRTIIDLLEKEKGSMDVKTIAYRISIRPNNTSTRLNILQRAGLVYSISCAKGEYYRINHQEYIRVDQLISKLKSL